MKRWTIILAIVVSIFAIIVGCQKRESTKEEIYTEFQKKIVTMSSYKCIAEVEAIGNKSSHNYVFVHSYKKPDYYKLEVMEPEHLKGKTMEYKDDKVIISNPDIEDKIELPNIDENKQYIFIGDFIKNYLQNEEVNIKLSGDSLSLETTIPGDNEYFYKQILYINKETKNPEKMEILNDKGNPSFVVKYKDFECRK
ncbi:germination lipoprotein GerS [Romboutsia sp. 13368]|uniref:germination lipoprotein GerS n=1 Tax=Romboutsia sp. 13368 TaxID=2708053 RepID=UPI0025D120FA|nr:germination lipoprotein GerS [Romboutsia sp. 13368]